MARSTYPEHSESYRTKSGTIPKACFSDDALNASGIIFLTEHQHASFDNDLVALRDILPKCTTASNAIQSCQYNCESIDPQHAISAQLYDMVVVLLNAIIHIQHLENCEQNLRFEKTALEARANRLNTLIVRAYL